MMRNCKSRSRDPALWELSPFSLGCVPHDRRLPQIREFLGGKLSAKALSCCFCDLQQLQRYPMEPVFNFCK
eukprot:6483852-Amphidinium_carterae.1